MVLKSRLLLLLVTLSAIASSCEWLLPGTRSGSRKIVTWDRDSFQFQHYDNWKPDTADEDYNPEGFFSMDSPSGSGICFVMVANDSVDPAFSVQNQIDAHLASSIKGGKVERFSRWGAYAGEGARIRGKILGMLPGQIRIFSHSRSDASFTVVQQIIDSDSSVDAPGQRLIERTFHLGSVPAGKK